MSKKLLLSSVLICLMFIGMAQVPEAFNYQAVVRNSSGAILADQDVSFRISILQGSESGTEIYAETHAVTTNEYGLVNLKIGEGVPVSGTFSPDGWGATSHFLKIEIDPSGGTAYTALGTSELLAVPYAFHAKTVEDDAVDDADADPANEIQTLSLSGSDLTLSDGGGTVTLPSPGTGDDWGAQTVVSDETLSGNGTSSAPLGVVGDLTDNQTLSVSGNDLTISNGNSVPLPTVWSLNGNTAYYNNGNIGIGTPSPVRLVNLLGDNSAHISFQDTYTGHGGGDGLLVGIEQSSNTAYVYNYENGSLRLGTNGTTGIQLHQNGFVGIGYAASAPSRMLDVNGGANNGYIACHTNTSGSTDADGLLIGIQTGSNNAYLYNYEAGGIYFGTFASYCMGIDPSGYVGINTLEPDQRLTVIGNASKSTGGAWLTYSDRRLKDVHGSYDKGLAEIVSLEPVLFNYKVDNPIGLPSDPEEIGLIAQEVREIFPEAVSETKSGYLNFDMHPINVAFINAFKELKTENDNLKERLDELESRLAEIEKMLHQ